MLPILLHNIDSTILNRLRRENMKYAFLPVLIMCLLLSTLEAGYHHTPHWMHRHKAEFMEKFSSLLRDVQEGKKSKDALNKDPGTQFYGRIDNQIIPLAYLASEKDPECLELMENFLIAGANPNILMEFRPIGDDGSYALYLAMKYGSNEGVRLLLKHGANAYNSSIYLHDLVEKLECNGADYTEKDFRSRELEIRENAELLLQHGADPNYSEYFDYRPPLLHRLIRKYRFYFYHCSGNPEPRKKEIFISMRILIDLFLRYGANPYRTAEASDSSYRKVFVTAIDYAHQEKLPQLARHLAMKFRIYKIAKLLSAGTKHDKSLGCGPLPYDMAHLIAQYRFNYFESLA